MLQEGGGDTYGGYLWHCGEAPLKLSKMVPNSKLLK